MSRTTIANIGKYQYVDEERIIGMSVENAKDLFADFKFHCSQAVFAAFSEQLGLSKEQALKIGGCFGSGMGCGEVCGCVTGALMALGLRYGQSEVGDYESRAKEALIAKEFMDRFAETHGSCICRDLLGYDFAKPEDRTYLIETKLYGKICPALVESAARILSDML